MQYSFIVLNNKKLLEVLTIHTDTKTGRAQTQKGTVSFENLFFENCLYHFTLL